MHRNNETLWDPLAFVRFFIIYSIPIRKHEITVHQAMVKH